MTCKILILFPLIVQPSQDVLGKSGRNSSEILKQDDPDRSKTVRARDTLLRDHPPPSSAPDIAPPDNQARATVPMSGPHIIYGYAT